MSKLTDSTEWKALEAHAEVAKTWHMKELFAKDPARAEKFSLEACGLFLDYSKNIITDETMAKLQDLLKSANFEDMRRKYFAAPCSTPLSATRVAIRFASTART